MYTTIDMDSEDSFEAGWVGLEPLTPNYVIVHPFAEIAHGPEHFVSTAITLAPDEPHLEMQEIPRAAAVAFTLADLDLIHAGVISDVTQRPDPSELLVAHVVQPNFLTARALAAEIFAAPALRASPWVVNSSPTRAPGRPPPKHSPSRVATVWTL